MVLIAAIDEIRQFSVQQMFDKLVEYTQLFNIECKWTENEVKLQLQLLVITGVTREKEELGTYEFDHPYYTQILKQIDRVDQNALEEALKNPR